MIYGKGKISLRQAFLLYITMLISPILRLAPLYTTNYAKRASWLSPLFSCIILILYFLALQKIFDKYKDASLAQVFEDILGKVISRIVIIIYLLLITILIAFFARVYVERILNTIAPNTSMFIFIVPFFILISYILHSDITPIARMNEIFSYLLAITLLFTCIFILPQIKIKNLYPITYKDIIPVFKGSIGISVLWLHIIWIFMFADRINNKENVKKYGIKVILFLTVFTSMITLITTGLFGASIVSKMTFPFHAAVKQISYWGIVDRVESIEVIAWVLSDFVLVIVLCFSALHMLKFVCKLPDAKPLINIYVVIVFFLTILLVKSGFELQASSAKILVPTVAILEFFIPLLIFIIAKIRRKI